MANKIKNKEQFSAPPYLLLKIGDKQYMEDLFYKGEIYMNTIEYYRNCEDSQIGDDLEGPSYYMGPGQVDFQFNDGTKIPVNIRELKLRMGENLNLYCLFGITQNHLTWNQENQIIPLSSLKNFGNHICIINDPAEFIRRVGDKLNKMSYEAWKCGEVKYFDKTHKGEVTPFMKRDIYKHQQEVRFVVRNDEGNPLKIEIGSIEDLCTLSPFDEEGWIEINFRKTKY